MGTGTGQWAIDYGTPRYLQLVTSRELTFASVADLHPDAEVRFLVTEARPRSKFHRLLVSI